MAKSICSWRKGEPCTNPRERHSCYCTEHRRQYQRERFRKGTVPKNSQLRRLAQLVADEKWDEARELARKVIKPSAADSSPPSGMQSVLDKYATPE